MSNRVGIGLGVLIRLDLFCMSSMERPHRAMFDDPLELTGEWPQKVYFCANPTRTNCNLEADLPCRLGRLHLGGTHLVFTRQMKDSMGGTVILPNKHVTHNLSLAVFHQNGPNYNKLALELLVDLPGIKSNWFLVTFVTLLKRCSMILSQSFIV
jgi:hypothetical protein